MNSYTQTNKPKKGTAKIIWDALTEAKVDIIEMHYNPNCWGNNPNDGWGTWAGTFRHKSFGTKELFAGLSDDLSVYVCTAFGNLKILTTEQLSDY